MRNIKWYGWLPDHPDPRDKIFSLRATAPPLPPSVKLPADLLPAIMDQGNLGSCTAHGPMVCDLYAAAKQLGANLSVADLARLFLYYQIRALEGTTDSDSGGQVRDALKALNKWGACREELWPYHISRFSKKPNKTAYADALNHQAIEYHRIPDSDLTLMRICLAEGFPYTFGFMVYEQFESDSCTKTGIVTIPDHNDILNGAIGGHCVAAIGYDVNKVMPDGKGAIVCRNSWGADWGDHGNFYLPYGYFAGDLLVSDIWTIRKVET